MCGILRVKLKRMAGLTSGAGGGPGMLFRHFFHQR
jgi:hypothetical protein